MASKKAPESSGPPLKEALLKIDRLIGESDFAKGADLLDANRAAFEANRGTAVYVEYLIQDARLFIKRRRVGDAKPILDRAEAAIDRLNTPESEKARLGQFLLIARADAMRIAGEPKDAIALLEKALRGRTEKDPITGYGTLELAKLLSEWGRVPDSVICLKQAIAIFEDCGDTFGLARSYSNLADVYGKLEEWGKAVEAARTGIDIAKANGHKRSEGFSSLNCAEALMRLGKLDEAKAFIMEAQDAFVKSEDHYFIAALNYMLGVLQNKEGAFELAADSLERSMENLEETDPRYLFALVHQEWASSLKALGDIEGAKEHLEEAVTAWEAVPNPKEAARVREMMAGLKDAKA